MRIVEEDVPESLFAVFGNPKNSITQDINMLKQLTTSPERLKRLQEMEADTVGLFTTFEEIKKLVHNKDYFAAHSRYTDLRKEWRERFFKDLADMTGIIKAERDVQLESPRVQARLRGQIRQLLFVAVVFNIALAAALAWYFNKTTVDRLARLMRNTRALSANQPLEPPVEGTDEIAILDKAFHETVEERRRIDEMKQDFVNMVSHDLRTPLTSLKAVFEMLDDDEYAKFTPAGRAILSQSTANATRLISLINDLLDYEQMQSGQLRIQKTELKGSDVVTDAVASLEGFAKQQGVVIQVHCDESARFLGDRDRLLQVTSNLLANAIKFSPENGTVKVSIETSEDDVLVCVADEGPGIPKEEQEVVFDKFAQGNLHSSRQRGSGLGLAICKKIVELHGGTIGVKSENGSGSEFWLRWRKS
jgi:signal transduction histidine kinase